MRCPAQMRTLQKYVLSMQTTNRRKNGVERPFAVSLQGFITCKTEIEVIDIDGLRAAGAYTHAACSVSVVSEHLGKNGWKPSKHDWVLCELKCVCRTHIAEPVVSMFFPALAPPTHSGASGMSV